MTVVATAAPAGPRTGDAPARAALLGRLGGLRSVLLLYGSVAVGLFAVVQLSVAFLPPADIPDHGFPDYPGFDGWTRWDTDWYNRIARLGYFYAGPGQQSAVNFFPGYPAAMRVVGYVTGSTIVAGVIVTYAAGLAAAALFWHWCRGALGSRTARLAVGVALVYPFAFFLFGAVYADALFLAAALGAFVLLEHDRPWLAGVAGAVATASRPVGIAVTIGLVVRALELRGVIGGGRPPFRGEGDAEARASWLPTRLDLRRLRARDAGVLLSVAGLAGFMALLWYRFDDPFAFTKVYAADGWNRSVDVETALKLRYFRLIRDGGFGDVPNLFLTLQGILTVLALVLVPVVVRRFGWGYGLYTATVLVMPFLGSPEFLAMGRYLLAAFPCFAAGAAVLARRPRLAAGWMAASGAGLVVMNSLFARWYFLG